MGIFKKATEIRVDQILSSTFGREVPIDFSFGASSGLVNGIDAERCVFAVNDDAIFVLSNARVVNLIPWKTVVDFKNDYGPGHFGLTYLSNQRNKQVRMAQYPAGYWHLEITRAFDESAILQMRDKYIKTKLEQGFTEDSLAIHKTWLDFSVTLPLNKTEFHKQNANWQTEEIRGRYYDAWLDYLDTESFIGFVARSICEGTVPSELLDVAIKEWELSNDELGKISGTIKTYNEKFYEVVELTKNLKLNTDSKTWILGKVETQPFESEVASEVPNRRIAVQVVPKGQGHPSIKIWNEFHSGDSGIIFDLDKFRANGKANVNSLEVFIDTENRSKACAIWLNQN